MIPKGDTPAIRHAADALSAIAIVGALAKVLPVIGAALGVIWYGLQIWWGVSDRIARSRGKKPRKDAR